MSYHAQCELRKGAMVQVSWIPQSFAIEGRVIDLKSDEGWDEGWIVKSVYDSLMWSVYAEQHSTGYRWHRSMTDAYRDCEGRWIMPSTLRPYSW